MDLQTLLKKHDEGTITRSERTVLHRLLKENHSYGDKMPEYRCPNCNKPLIYTWAFGPVCMWSEGGCGFSFRN